MADAILLTQSGRGQTWFVAAAGRWDIANAGRLEAELTHLAPPRDHAVQIDLGNLERLDTTGAWLLHRTRKRLEDAGIPVDVTPLHEAHAVLLQQVAANDRPRIPRAPRPNAFVAVVERIGANTVSALRQTRDFVGFFGLVLTVLAGVAVRPRRLRFTSFVHHMEEVGLNALPIVGLLSFLIGVVLAYQGASQLQHFGAELFVINLISVSVLRELGILITAIVVAGRSGSAFTAQIGSMKVREEVDAMRTLGLDPIEVLVLPRMLALVVTLPILGFFAALLGLVGGGIMCWVALGISPAVFLDRLRDAASLSMFWVGMIKAPFFAMIIALIGCYEGLRVQGSAESVGQLTTRSVVESIFLVIVADALFSVFFNLIGI